MRLLLLIVIFTLSGFADSASAQRATKAPASQRINEVRIGQAGIRKIVGRHLWIYTDLPGGNAVDELPLVFDQAVEQWAAYFHIPREQLADWRVRGYLIDDRERFATLGLLPEQNANFVNGYATGQELWLMRQPSAYYTRHLMLHEGTHALMLAHLGGTGPGWYMEGLAELLGTHRWEDGQLRLNIFPADKDAVPMWGRIALIRQAYDQRNALELGAVLQIQKNRALSTTEYAWSWALCKFLDSHPRYQEKFHDLRALVREPQFNLLFRKRFQREWDDLLVEWQAYVAALDYGYDTERMAMVHAENKLVDGEHTTTIAADRGWQSTGWLLEPGKEYKLTAEGRYQIAYDNAPWPCEPNGVTLVYHQGNPLGMLLGALRSTAEPQFTPGLKIGLGTTLKVEQPSVLYLRVNDAPNKLSNNQGTISIAITP